MKASLSAILPFTQQTTRNENYKHRINPTWRFHSDETKTGLFLDLKECTRTQELPIRSASEMEEEKQTNMSKKEANKYMRFLIKEWSTADNEVLSAQNV